MTTTLTPQLQEIAKAVREHARAHYEEDGWDFVIECWEDADIVRAMGNARNAEQAIREVKRVVKVMNSRRRDHEMEGGF